MNERETMNAWHNLFRRRPPTPEILATAEQLLGGISGESPIRFRLESELEELKACASKEKKKRTVH